MNRLLLLFALGSLVLAQGRPSVLLGVVRVEKDKKVFVARVLPDSPAAQAGLEAGDELVEIDGRDIESARDVDAALDGLRPGEEVPVVYRRGAKRSEAKAKLMDRRAYRHESFQARPRGKVGFPAPAWHVYAWANVKKGREPPTQKSTKGKIVVFHAFQSW